MTHPSCSRRTFLQTAGAGLGALAAMSGAGAAAAEPGGKSTPGTAKFQLGLASYTTRKFGLEETLRMAKRVGLHYLCFKSVHLPLDATEEQIRKTREEVEKAGLTLYGGGVITMKNEAEVEQAFRYADLAGMSVIVGVPYPEVLAKVDAILGDYPNIRVAIHNHGPGDKIYPTPEVAYEKIKGLNERLGLCVDIGHVTRYGEDPVRSIKTCAERVFDVHLKDVTKAAADGGESEVGRGVIDLPAVLTALIEIGFGGIASFEYEKDPDDPLPGLAESVGYVRGVLAML